MPEPLPHVVREPICIWPQLSPSGAAPRFRAAHCRHQAIGSPERRVGDDKVIYAPSRIVTAQEAIGFEENVRLLAVHPPFHNRARKVPRDVSWTRKEMVIAVAA